ncbi:MAG: response regulator transcription factor [Prolixibacteraceae bacterium]|nr:response regulator transcription factor [Prolixibacteraceae bacterium]
MNILVVDDDPNVIEMVSDLLIDEQYNVMVAPNGEAALEVGFNESPDLIIMDWEMPIMDGISALKKLKSNANTKNTPVIMITGRMTSVVDLKTAFDAGAIDFIRKPIDPIELIARTRSMLMLSVYYKESVRKKDWELTLLSRTNAHNDQLLSEVTEMLEKMHKKCSMVDMFMYNELRDKIRKVRSSINNNAWEQFENYFRNVHPNFHENLLNEHPKINPEELKLCYLLRLNMNSKEIATLTNREVNSVDIARYRLRKKLKLDRDVKLHEYLAQF